MKTSELINVLKHKLIKNGDLEVKICETEHGSDAALNLMSVMTMWDSNGGNPTPDYEMICDEFSMGEMGSGNETSKS